MQKLNTREVLNKIKLGLFGLLAIPLFISANAIAQSTDTPATEYDEFSGVQIITDPNYSTGAPTNTTSRTTYLMFSKLSKDALNIPQIKTVQTALTQYFNAPKYIAVESENVNIDTRTGTIQTRIQVNRSGDAIYDLSLRYVTGSDSAVITTLKKGGSTVLVHVGGLNPTSGPGYTITQKGSTSTDLRISGQEREAALQHITSLGYKVPDFRIEFTNQESPFNEK